jgi:hypothetical protein
LVPFLSNVGNLFGVSLFCFWRTLTWYEGFWTTFVHSRQRFKFVDQEISKERNLLKLTPSFIEIYSLPRKLKLYRYGKIK